jgi:hypothetical protein
MGVLSRAPASDSEKALADFLDDTFEELDQLFHRRPTEASEREPGTARRLRSQSTGK